MNDEKVMLFMHGVLGGGCESPDVQFVHIWLDAAGRLWDENNKWLQERESHSSRSP